MWYFIMLQSGHDRGNDVSDESKPFHVAVFTFDDALKNAIGIAMETWRCCFSGARAGRGLCHVT